MRICLDGVHRLWAFYCMWHGIYGDIILGRAGVYLEGSVQNKYTLIGKIDEL